MLGLYRESVRACSVGYRVRLNFFMWLSVGTICLDLVAPNVSKVVRNFANPKNVKRKVLLRCAFRDIL